MAITEMKRLDLLVHVNDIDSVVNDITWLGAVEVSSSDGKLADDEWSSLIRKSNVTETLLFLDRRLVDINNAIATLAKLDTTKKKMFAPKDVLTRQIIDSPGEMYENGLKVADDVNSFIKKRTELKNEINRLNLLRLSLEPWINLDVPLSTSGTSNSIVMLGFIPAAYGVSQMNADLSSQIDVNITEISHDAENTYIALICHINDEYDLNTVLSACNFSKLTFRDINVTASEKIIEIDKNVDMYKKETEVIDEKIKSLVSNIPLLQKCYDITLAKQTEVKFKQEFMHTSECAFIQGYIPAKKVDKLQKIIEKYLCTVEISDVDLDNAEDIPILLENKKIFSPYESVVGLYSYPLYTGIDPTAIMSVFYFIIFGMMLGDFVYGLILTVGGFLWVKLLKPKKGMRDFLLMFAISGIGSMIAGILFGSYLGDIPSAIATNIFGRGEALNQAVLFDPIQNPIGYLVISMVIGVIHMFTGMGIKMYMLIKRGQVLDAVFGVGMWYLIFGGIGLAALNSNLIVITFIGILGMATMKEHSEKNILLRLLKGIAALYDSIAYISDLLSYARILALGLSASVISMVVNLLGTMAGAPLGFITVIISTLLGHGLNLALSVLGSFVHAARLQYIEFFNKFYEDGGRLFSPVTLDTKYTSINFEEVNN